MRKVILVFLAIFTLTSACAAPLLFNSQPETLLPRSETIQTEDPIPLTDPSPTPDPTLNWPVVTGPQPSPKMAAFYYPWYFTPEFDGVWEH